ncbi:unnamed protein product [Euphydryas editha]|uniref:Gem-associated protein 2 n=1 Tax=Euphydryas editha TaxID=104508 RepID=A0AAU9URN0_EUPED|nr:unnamed protein product [Euphydryas editha]
MKSNKKCFHKKVKFDGDSDSLLTPCFQINSDVVLKEIPTTGEEYLLRVIKEREKFSTVSKCDKDFSKFAKNQSCFVEELPHSKAPDNLRPTIEWQNIQVADFSDVRMYVSRMLSKKALWPDDVLKLELNPNNIPAWKNLFEKDPKLSCVLGLHSAMLDRGLEILTEILDDVKPGSTLDHKIGQWIYAFLACTRPPLISDTTSILRNLARKCAEIRSHLDPDDESSKTAAVPLNIFICLVSRYFRQYDLAD